MAASNDKHSANPGFALSQLAKALQTSQEHHDPETRERGVARVARWMQTLQGMITGSLAIGSRTPVESVPAWATLEVVTGGFATGNLMAEAPLQQYERDFLARIGESASTHPRLALNVHYLTEEGIGELLGMLESGCYRLGVPEEGALLVIAWLIEQGRSDAARALLDELMPFMSRLRFYPVPSTRPIDIGERVFIENVGAVIAALKRKRTPADILHERSVVEYFLPLFDRLVSLFLETIDGETPRLSSAEDGGAPGRAIGGWPCKQFPGGWRERAVDLLSEISAMPRSPVDERSLGSGRPNFLHLVKRLEVCVDDPSRLTGRDVGMIRHVLACTISKRGEPGSLEHRALRDRQHTIAARPTVAELARVIVDRLRMLPEDTGIERVDDLIGVVTAVEAEAYSVPEGVEIPQSLRRTIMRGRMGTVDELVTDGLVTSADVLARLVPQITAAVRSEPIVDERLRTLYHATYRAFNRRRSLLLLNLESQVRIEELPWVKAIESMRLTGLGDHQAARATLVRVVRLALAYFPHQIFPNKLLSEISALSKSADIAMPIVNELAADIFMGEFSTSFLRAAHDAADLLQGTLYERYYRIDFAAVRAIDDITASRWGTKTSAGFARMCYARAGEFENRGVYDSGFVARNGKVIEQQQILTTHNLATLFTALGLRDEMRDELPERARQCFVWICHRLETPINDRHALKIMAKNCAYAWRQMVFYLSMVEIDEQAGFVSWARSHLGAHPQAAARLHASLEGLADAVLRRSSAHDPLVGWTVGEHPLMVGSS